MRCLYFRRSRLAFLAVMLTSSAYCQRPNKNGAYVEFLGNAGSWLSLNYEKSLAADKEEANRLAARAGLSFSFNQYVHHIAFHFPLELIGIHGRGKWKLEYGLGYTAYFGTSNLDDDRIPEEYKSNYGSWIIPRIGIRHDGRNRGLFRLAPMYVWEIWSNGRSRSFWSVGLSIGSYL